MHENILELQDKIIVELAQAIDHPWDLCVVNIEIDDIEGQLVKDCVCITYKKKFMRYTRGDFILPYPGELMLAELRKAYKDPWTICTLEFAKDGRYKFDFSYDPPPRLNGNFDDQALFNNYKPKMLSKA